MTCVWVAPAALPASRGPISIPSTVSESSFAMMESENMIMASAPAKGFPNPTAVAKKMAQMRSGMVRMMLRNPLANRYMTLFGDVILEAKNARGRARTFPVTAPTMAIWRVSMNGWMMLKVSGWPRLLRHFHTGGQKSSVISWILASWVATAEVENPISLYARTVSTRTKPPAKREGILVAKARLAPRPIAAAARLVATNRAIVSSWISPRLIAGLDRGARTPIVVAVNRSRVAPPPHARACRPIIPGRYPGRFRYTTYPVAAP